MRGCRYAIILLTIALAFETFNACTSRTNRHARDDYDEYDDYGHRGRHSRRGDSRCIRKLNALVEDAERNGGHYSSKQWERSMKKYSKLVEAGERQYYRSFSNEDQESFYELQTRYTGAMIKYNGGDIIRGGFNAGVGVLQGIDRALNDGSLDDIMEETERGSKRIDESSEALEKTIEETMEGYDF